MASDQIDYCGECPHYGKCQMLALEGRLKKCAMDNSSKD